MFAQSHVTAHAEAAWLLSAVTSYGQLGRMTAVQGEGRPAGVRVGRPLHLPDPDGGRHPALPDRLRADRRRPAPAPRALARHRRALQRALRRDVQGARDGIYPEVGARIMDLQEPTKKMSTTGGTPQGTLLMLDPPDVIRKKVRSAVTDSGSEVRRADDKPGVTNLIDIMSVATGEHAGGDRGALRRRRLRAVQVRRRRGRRRAARADPDAVRRAPRRPGRADAAARRRRRERPRGVGADARDDVRPHGLRAPRALVMTDPAGERRWEGTSEGQGSPTRRRSSPVRSTWSR